MCWAFELASLARGAGDRHLDEELQLAEVSYAHALRRFKSAHSELSESGLRTW